MNWNDYQRAIFARLQADNSHLVIQARAGTGKTTTSIEAMRHLTGSTAALAFGAEIAKTLQQRVPEGVDARTFHSFGLRALHRHAPGVYKVSAGIAAKQCAQRFKAMSAADTRGMRPWHLGHALARAVEIMKADLIPFDNLEAIDSALDARELDVPLVRGLWVDAVADELRLGQNGSRTEIDFADMIWLPIVLNARFPLFDNIIADEAQDLTLAQHQIALRSCKRNGRIIAVGDDRQAIYAFRGADAQSMPRLISKLQAPTALLPVCYRCPRQVVRLAKEIVPDIEWHTGADEGIIVDNASVEDAVPGDVIISRTNAELVALCLRWIGEGKPAAIVGNDMLKTLKTFIVSSKADTTVDLLRYTRTWADKEVERLQLLERSTTHVQDREACIAALSRHADTTAKLLDLLETISAPEQGRAIKLTSAHRAKGLEFRNVYMLEPTFDRVRARTAKQGKSTVSEDNLRYVALTRAMERLAISREEIIK